jgi:flagellar basal body-associated protein FliL
MTRSILVLVLILVLILVHVLVIVAIVVFVFPIVYPFNSSPRRNAATTRFDETCREIAKSPTCTSRS